MNSPVTGSLPGRGPIRRPPGTPPPPPPPPLPPADPAQELRGVLFVLEVPEGDSIERHRPAIERALGLAERLLAPAAPTAPAIEALPIPPGRSPLARMDARQRRTLGDRLSKQASAKAQRDALLRGVLAQRDTLGGRRVATGSAPRAVGATIRPLFSPPPSATAIQLQRFRLQGLHRFHLLELPIGHAELDIALGPAKRARLFDIKALLQQHTQLSSVAVDLPIDGLAGSSGTTRPSTPATVDWHLRAIGLADPSTGARRHTGVTGAGVRIAHPDTGWTPHPDVPAGNLDLAHELNVFNPLLSAQEPIDSAWRTLNDHHGTATGSLIVSPDQAGSGLQDVLGVATGARLVPIRCASAVVLVGGVSLTVAVLHAVFAGADIISMSLGGLGGKHLQLALKFAAACDVIPIAAAGNMFPLVAFPALYRETIAVAAIADGDVPMSQANASFGTAKGCAVDIAAPGAGIHRAHWTTEEPIVAQRSASDGTSYATAITAGAAALWLQRHGKAALLAGCRPGETLVDVFRGQLQATARRPAIWDTSDMGPGILDIDGLLDPAALAAYRAKPLAVTGLALLNPVMDWQMAIVKMLCPYFGIGAVQALLEDLLGAGEAIIEELGEELVAILRTSERFAKELGKAVRAHVKQFVNAMADELRALLASAGAALRAVYEAGIAALAALAETIDETLDTDLGALVASASALVEQTVERVAEVAQDIADELRRKAAAAKRKVKRAWGILTSVVRDGYEFVSERMTGTA